MLDFTGNLLSMIQKNMDIKASIELTEADATTINDRILWVDSSLKSYDNKLA